MAINFGADSVLGKRVFSEKEKWNEIVKPKIIKKVHSSGGRKTNQRFCMATFQHLGNGGGGGGKGRCCSEIERWV